MRANPHDHAVGVLDHNEDEQPASTDDVTLSHGAVGLYAGLAIGSVFCLAFTVMGMPAAGQEAKASLVAVTASFAGGVLTSCVSAFYDRQHSAVPYSPAYLSPASSRSTSPFLD